MRRPKVLFLINSLAGGGAERVMNTLLTHSEPERRDFDFSLALLDKMPAAYAPPSWLPVHQMDCAGSLLRSLKGVKDLVRAQRPALCLSFLTRANAANVWASRAFGSKAVISERVNTSSHFGTGPRSAVSRGLVRFSYPKADRIIAVSAGVAEDLQAHFGVPPAKLTVIDNPLDTEGIREKATLTPAMDLTEPYLLAMGRLAPNKNFALVITAFARSQIPGLLVVLGEGPERQALEKLVLDLGLEDRVLLPGFVDNPFALLRRASAFILCSNAEGFPNGLVEAMALGTPVIATNCPSGPSEILANQSRQATQGLVMGEHGILVDPNSVEQMAEAIRRLSKSDTRSAYSKAASRRAEDFRIDTAKTRYWDVIRSEIGGLQADAVGR